MVDVLPDRQRKGRGAVSNRSGRFEAQARIAIDDGWGDRLGEDEDLPPLRTTVIADSSRSAIARNQSPDIPFDRSINPYRGCEHGCVYCFARPTHAWLGFSAGLDFETRIVAKHNVAALLQAELAKPSYRPQPIALGTNTDPYQPLERRLGLTRQVLQVLADCRHPFSIVTKSDLVLRDLDILAPLAEQRLVRVMISLTTLDRGLARTMEPRAPTPKRRLAAIAALNEAGVPCGVMTAPMIPTLNDGELDSLLAAGAAAGARSAGYVLLRLPLEIRELFVEWLEAHFPERKAKVMNQIRAMRGGRDYDATFGRRFRGGGVYADTLAKRFQLACRRHGLDRNAWDLDCSLFQRPPPDSRQLSLL